LNAASSTLFSRTVLNPALFEIRLLTYLYKMLSYRRETALQGAL